MKNKTTLILIILFGINTYVFSDTIYCCQSDTLKLAYYFEDSLYNEGCDIQIDDIVMMDSGENIFIEMEPTGTNFEVNLYTYLNPLCEWIICDFENNITEISQDGVYSGGHPEYDYTTSFKLIRGELYEVEDLFIYPTSNDPIKYSAKIKNDFRTYSWSTGSNSHTIQIDEPGEYIVEVKSYCNEIFEKTISFSETDFDTESFNAGKAEGEGITYIDLNPDTIVQFFHGGPQGEKYLEFDIDNNSTEDLGFSVHFGSAMGAWGWALSVTPLNGCQVAINNHYKIAARLNEGQIINDVISYSGVEKIVLCDESGDSWGNSCFSGYWQNSNDYLAFLLPVGSDTLIGWMNLSFAADWNELNFVIHDFAYFVPNSNNIHESPREKFAIFPNPFSTEFFIETELSDYNIELLDITGSIIYAAKEIKRIELTNVPKGMYILKLSSGDEEFFQKIIKH